MALPAPAVGEFAKTLRATAAQPTQAAEPTQADQPVAPPRGPHAATAAMRRFAKEPESPAPAPASPLPRSPGHSAPYSREARVDLASGEARATRAASRRASAVAQPAAEATPAWKPDAEETPPRAAEHTPPAAAKPEPLAIRQRAPWREADQQIADVVRAVSFFVDDDGTVADRPRGAGFAVPAPMRRHDPDRLVNSATRELSEMPAAVPQPPIEVTIGKIEVTIEGDPRPPLRAIRPVEPRGGAARQPVPPPRAGRLARLYLDR